jgi:hypothetical protein
MQIRTFACNSILFLAFTLPVALQAQFPPPTQEELKMTSDPKAPGASAVYLNVVEDDSDTIHKQVISARIKVLTEKGKELATVELPYLQGAFRIMDLQGRTIHSDGTIIPLTGKPEDLLRVKSGQREIKQMVFTLPSVEVGSILEYRYEIQYGEYTVESPEWDIQKKYFVHSAHYSFTPYENFMPHPQMVHPADLVDAQGRVASTLVWVYNLPKGTAIQTWPDRYSVDLTDIPASPDEEWMPPIQSVLYRVEFYYLSRYSIQDYWAGAGKEWSKQVERFAEPSRAIKDAVAGLIAPGDSELVKAQKIYAAVQALDNTDYSRTKTASEMKALNLKEAKHAEDTWKQKSGSAEDIALLYLAMARAAGLTAYAMKVVDRDQRVFDPSYMTMSQFDDTIVILEIAGNRVTVDPGEKMCTFGELNWRHAGTGGIWQSDSGPGFQQTPSLPYTANLLTRAGNITLDEHGAMAGDIQFTMKGQQALRWRQTALENDPDEVKKQFDEWLQAIVPEGTEAHVDHFVGIDQPGENLVAVIHVKGALGTATAKRLILPGYFFAARGNTPFVNQENRKEPVDMQYGEHISDQIVYHLPAGFTVDGAPQDTKIAWPGHAVYITKSQASPGQIVIARSMARAFDQAKPEEYQDLRGFYQKVAAADQADVVLTMTAPRTGN